VALIPDNVQQIADGSDEQHAKGLSAGFSHLPSGFAKDNSRLRFGRLWLAAQQRSLSKLWLA
jgi:hypothetical protein